MTTTLSLDARLGVPFQTALQRTREALKTEGFGILFELDMPAIFREKLGAEFRPYVILGACNPPLAWKAMNTDPRVGLLLPCNVTVEQESDGSTLVRVVDPVALIGASPLADSEPLAEVARDARARLERVVQALAA